MLRKWFEAGKAQLERDLAGATDVKAACDIAARFLDDIRRKELDEADDPSRRTALNQLMATAQSGLVCMASVTQVDISMRLLGSSGLPQVREGQRKTWRAALSWAPCALSCVVAAFLLLSGSIPAAIVSGIAAAAGLVQPISNLTKRQAVPDVSGTTRVDAIELSRRIERMVTDVDSLMEARLPQPQEPLQLSTGMLEAVQMLMEAHMTGDAQFALKALPQMTMALEKQGIDVLMCEPDTQDNFDLLPAMEGGQTIRPALVKDGRPLVRGQATIGNE